MVVKRRGERGRRKAAALSTVRSELQARVPQVSSASNTSAEVAEVVEQPTWEHLEAWKAGEEDSNASDVLNGVLGRIERFHEPLGQDSLAFELLFYVYLVVHLLLQNYNIYKANVANYNVSLLLLTMMTLCKRIMLKYLSSTGGVAAQLTRGAHTVMTLALIAAVTVNSVFFIVQLFVSHPLVNFLFLFYPSLLSVFIFGVSGKVERRANGRAVLRRFYKLLYSSLEYAYYVGVLPLRFLQHDYIYYDVGRCILLVVFVFINSAVMLVAHLLQTSFIDLFIQVQELGRWEPYRPGCESEKAKECVGEWNSERGPYRKGEVVTHQGSFFIAKYPQNTVQPGRIFLPMLLLVLFSNPNRTHLALIGVQGVVVTVQLGLLITSNHWSLYGVMLAFSYVVMFYCVRTRRRNLKLFRHYSFDSLGGALPGRWPSPGEYSERLRESQSIGKAEKSLG